MLVIFRFNSAFFRIIFLFFVKFRRCISIHIIINVNNFNIYSKFSAKDIPYTNYIILILFFAIENADAFNSLEIRERRMNKHSKCCLLKNFLSFVNCEPISLQAKGSFYRDFIIIIILPYTNGMPKRSLDILANFFICCSIVHKIFVLMTHFFLHRFVICFLLPKPVHCPFIHIHLFIH